MYLSDKQSNHNIPDKETQQKKSINPDTSL